jgi:hypothetical protein
MNRAEVINKVKALNLPLGEYIVIGGSCLAIKEIRESKDIDILITPELFEELQSKGWEVDAEFEKKWDRKRLVRSPYELYTTIYIEQEDKHIPARELIAGAEYYEGFPFLPLKQFLSFKRSNLNRPKDIADVALIEDYISKNTI